MTQQVKYYFAHYNLLVSEEDNDEYMVNVLNSQQRVIRGNYKWGFFDCREIEVEGEQFIFGYLVKYLPTVEVPTVDEETSERTTEEVESGRVAESPFFVHIPTHLIVYHPVANKIGIKQFGHVVEELVTAYRDHLFISFNFGLLTQQVQFLQELRSFDKIERITIKLWRANPNFRERKRIEDRLNRLKATVEEKIVAESSEGLNIEGDEETLEKIEMADQGFGESTAKGFAEGDAKTISTNDFPIEGTAPKVEDVGEQGVVGSIIGRIREVFWNRIDNADSD